MPVSAGSGLPTLVWCTVFLTATSIASGQSRLDGEAPHWSRARERMVREEVAKSGVENERVLEAMRTTPRHLFVPEERRDRAYLDMALPIGGAQTISPPLVVARMTEAIQPQPTDRVLEIGTGSGYQAAVLSPLVKDVYSIEIVESLGRRAARTLRRLDYDNVHTRIGDGFAGWPEKAPFDKIIVTCSPQEVPPALVEQLREGGQIVVPLGERFQQTLYLLQKVDGNLEIQALEPTFFVPMTGRAEELRQSAADAQLPRVVNGSFEEAGSGEDASEPAGWYYIRQAQIAADAQAPDGAHVLQLSNTTPGRAAQMLQAVGMDGRRVKRIELAASFAPRDVRPGGPRSELPGIGLTFYDQRRAPIRRILLGPVSGTSKWKTQTVRTNVPAQARLAVMVVSMFGSVGQLRIDGIEVRIISQSPPK